jgi:L-iditol 2-dehydrogenase
MGSIATPTELDSGKVLLRTSHQNPSLKATADHQIKIEESPVYGPGPGEVLLHVKATGICG